MKPFKSGTIVAAWLLRMTILWFVYEHYYKGFPGFDLKSFSFYIHAAYLVFAVMLVVGGFHAKTRGNCFIRTFYFYPAHCSAHSCFSP